MIAAILRFRMERCMAVEQAVRNEASEGSALRDCPVCGEATGESTPGVVTSGAWRVVKCERCSMVYLANPPELEAVGTEFAWTESWNAEKQRRVEREKLLHGVQAAVKRVTRRMKPRKWKVLVKRYLSSGNILDVGCGNGKRLLECQSEGLIDIVPHGIEIEPGPAQAAKKKFGELGGAVWIGGTMEVAGEVPAESMDGSFMYAYLEHEPQPRDAMREVLRVLRPGAPVVIKVPNHGSWNRVVRGEKWCGYRHPDHVNYFTPVTMERMLKDCGYAVVRSGFLDHPPLNDNLWAVAKKPG